MSEISVTRKMVWYEEGQLQDLAYIVANQLVGKALTPTQWKALPNNVERHFPA